MPSDIGKFNPTATGPNPTVHGKKQTQAVDSLKGGLPEGRSGKPPAAKKGLGKPPAGKTDAGQAAAEQNGNGSKPTNKSSTGKGIA